YRSLAVSRALATSIAVVAPNVMRRCLSPTLYWNIQLREPPSRMRMPSPAMSSSNTIRSAWFSASCSDLIVRSFSFTEAPLNWEEHGGWFVRTSMPGAARLYTLPTEAIACCRRKPSKISSQLPDRVGHAPSCTARPVLNKHRPADGARHGVGD